MYRKSSNFLDYGIEVDIDPKQKYNSLLSATVSTIMCLAANCPLPKCNVETTKLFLSKITDDNGNPPRNVKAILRFLENYDGPYETDPSEEKLLEKIHPEKPKSKLCPIKDTETKICTEYDAAFKGSQSSVQISPKDSHVVETHMVTKRVTKLTGSKRGDKDPKKLTKTLGAKISSTKSMITKI